MSAQAKAKSQKNHHRRRSRSSPPAIDPPGSWILPSNREALSPPRALTVSEWAQASRIMGPESPIPGRWKNRNLPYLTAPMDAFNDPVVEKIVLVFAAQSGKTEFELNCLGYIIDEDPGTVLIVYDSERQADRVMRRRVHPMVLSSPDLKRHFLGNSDDLGLKEITFDRCFIQTAWSNSPGALASFPCRYVILDEVDKYPLYAGREASPIALAEVRTRTFRGRRKILEASTPTLETAYIWGEYLRSDQQKYWLPCPHCGRFQVLDFFAGLKYEKDRTPDEIRVFDLAWYECAGCKERILDEHKQKMLARGRWLQKSQTFNADGEVEGETRKNTIRGYQLSALYSPFVSFGEVAAKWKEVQGDIGELQGFMNSWLGLPWQEKIESLTEKKILATKRLYPPGIVPAEARVLTAGVDVQADHFWFTIRAWGLEERSWLIRHGTVQTWEQVWAAVSAGYECAGGGRMTAERVLVDSGFRTSEVYEFCREHFPITLATKGSNNPALVSPIRMGRPAPGTILWTFKADFYKDRLASLIGAKVGGHGEWMTHREIDETYIQHLTSERRVIERGAGRRFSTWKPLTESTPNHLFDTEILCVIAADQLGVRFMVSEQPAPAPRASAVREEGERGRERGEGWLRQDGGWMSGEGGRLWDG